MTEDELAAWQLAYRNLNAEYERLRGWIMDVYHYSATCDWGYCDGATVGLRADPRTDSDLGAIQDWLWVCQAHYDEAPERERLYFALDELRAALESVAAQGREE